MKFSLFFLKLIAALSASTLLSSVCVIAGVTQAQSRELIPTSATKQLKANLSIEQIDQIPQEITLLLTEGKITGKASNTRENGYGLSYSNSTIAPGSGGGVLNPLNSYQKWIGGQQAITVADNPSESELTADDWYNRGLEKQNSGDNQGAIEDYRDYKGAIEDYTQAIGIDRNYAGAYYNRGNARYNLGHNQGAIEDYTEAINIDPNYAGAYNNRGNARDNLGDITGAIKDYTEAISIDRNFAEAYANRGNARYNLGDITGAIEDLEKAAELWRQQGDPRAAEVEETIRQMR